MPFISFATRPSAIAREEYAFLYCLKKGVKEMLVVPLNKELSYLYADEESWSSVLRKLVDEALADVDKHIRNYAIVGNTFVQKAFAIASAVKKQDKTAMVTSYKSYCQALYDFSVYFITPFGVTMYLEPKLNIIFPGQFSMITMPERPLLMPLIQNLLLTRLPEEVAKEYGWINSYNIKEPPYTAEYFENLKKTIDAKKIGEIFEAAEKNRKEFAAFISTVADKKLRDECVLLHEYAFMKTDRVEFWRKAMSYQRELFVYLAEMLGWTIDETINLDVNEIEGILLKNKMPKREDITIRAEKKCFYHYYDNKMHVLTDPNDMDRISKRLLVHTHDGNVIKGIAASKGKAIGRVVIVNHKSEAHKIKVGDILVAIYTTPELTPYLKKCAAFVTDEGGLVAHAAIIAREMGKPCVIDTKIATKVLKDGDRVEVDAENGVVRKL